MIATIISEENAGAFLPVIPTEALTRSDVFFGAVEENENIACGVIAAQALENHILSISFLYVDPSFRNMGAGHALVSALIDFAEMTGVVSVICSHHDGLDRNSELICRLLKSCNFSTLEYTRNCTYTIAINDISIKKVKPFGSIVPLRSVSKAAFSDYAKKVQQLRRDDSGGTVVSLNAISDYDKDISLMCLDSNKNPVGAILFFAEPDGLYLADFRGFGTKTPKIMYSLLQTAYERASDLLPSDSSIYINTDSENYLKTIEKITNTEAEIAWSSVVDAYFI